MSGCAYEVGIRALCHYYIRVEADSAEEAVQLAIDEAYNGRAELDVSNIEFYPSYVADEEGNITDLD